MAFKRQTLTPRVVQDLEKRSEIGSYFYIIAVCVVLFADGYYLRHPSFSIPFFILIVAISMFRLLHRFFDPWMTEKFGRGSLYLFIASIVMTGLVWGIGFATFMGQEGELNIKLLMVVCTIGLCAGGVVAYLPLLWLSISYNLFILGPGIAIILAGLHLPLAILVILFSVYMVLIAIRGSNEYWKALETEFLLEEKTKHLERISQKDGLTGLYNRRYFDAAFELEWKRGGRARTPIAMMICDIDEFKQVNDTFGHLAGDEYLKLVARILLQVFQRETDLIARYGGEEFVVILPGDSLENARGLAERVREMISVAILEFESQIIQTTVSLGVAIMTPHHSRERDTLIASADAALYVAKKNGRNQVCVHGDTRGGDN